jgi:hypothetical protein
MGMKTANAWRIAAWWLRRENGAHLKGCDVTGCPNKPAIAVAGDGSRTTFMCTHHAVAWSQSNLCRDYAQHNSGASPAALRAWLSAGAEAS